MIEVHIRQRCDREGIRLSLDAHEFNSKIVLVCVLYDIAVNRSSSS